MIKFIILLIVLSAHSAFADKCEHAVQTPGEDLVHALSKITDEMYKDVAKLKVNLDGEGKISVHFDKGKPTILRFSYRNSKGLVNLVIPFDDLEKGIPLVYENKDKKGKAIVLEKGEKFKDGSKFNFKFSVRSGMPDRMTSYPVEFDANPNAPKLYHEDCPVSQITLSPGVSFLSWDGTFKRVEFN